MLRCDGPHSVWLQFCSSHGGHSQGHSGHCKERESVPGTGARLGLRLRQGLPPIHPSPGPAPLWAGSGLDGQREGKCYRACWLKQRWEGSGRAQGQLPLWVALSKKPVHVPSSPPAISTGQQPVLFSMGAQPPAPGLARGRQLREGVWSMILWVGPLENSRNPLDSPAESWALSCTQIWPHPVSSPCIFRSSQSEHL